MKRYHPKYEKLATISTFILIPLSGLVTDVYLPSFPNMQQALDTDVSGIQLTLTYFLLSYGISMLFAGSIADTFGRYRLVIGSLVLFAFSNFAIAIIHQIEFVYVMRVLQGFLTALIVVAKRAFLADIFEGKTLRKHTSSLTVVWALAPIMAPFIGGYLQIGWGWTANFYFLGVYSLLSLMLELRYGGEALTRLFTFRPKGVLAVYRRILRTNDFTYGVITLGISYSMVMVFAMSAPFIIEHELGFSPIVTGYSALVSGLGLFCGGSVGRILADRPLFLKLHVANATEWVLAIAMFLSGFWFFNLYSLMSFVFLAHVASGFLYNGYFTHCLTRFPKNAGIAGGITSGGGYLVTAAVSYAIVAFIPITDQKSLACSYLILSAATTGLIIAATKGEYATRTTTRQQPVSPKY